MPSLNLQEYIKQRRALIEQALQEWLPSSHDEPKLVHEAMRYAVLSGGKRLRPVLTLAVSDVAGRPVGDTLNAACSIELVHAASLVLDDLPSMDNARLRRGVPCTHVRYGEATAILSAMGLVALAFDLLTRSRAASSESSCKAVRELASAIGSKGIISGQYVDLTLKANPTTLARIESIYREKAAALFIASVRIPAALLGMNEEETRALTEFAQNLGLAFQICDDLLDAHQAPEDTGRQTHATYLGVDGARSRIENLTTLAGQALVPFADRAAVLLLFAEYVKTRTS